MARPLRVEFSGAIYHVMIRSQEEVKLFLDERDHLAFCERIAKATDIFSLELYAYCLMPNHVHLFVCTPQGNLSQAMQWLGTAYTVWFNRRHERHGHLFQGRYKSLLVGDDTYFAAVSRYIHLNPVKAGLVLRPEEWPWSSYRGYWRKKHTQAFVHYKRILKTMAESDPEKAGRRQYCTFVTEGLDKDIQSPWQDAWHGFILGSDAFREQIIEIVRSQKPRIERDIPLSKQITTHFTIDDIKKAVAAECGMSIDSLERSIQGKQSHPRSVAMYLCRRLTGSSCRQIGLAFGINSDSTVTIHCQKVKDDDPLLERVSKRLHKHEKLKTEV